MSNKRSGFLGRLGQALRVGWRLLTDEAFARRVEQVEVNAEIPSPPGTTSAPLSAPLLRATVPDSALQLLSLLQKEGRFVDFLQENVATYSDAEIGGAARLVHEGCRKVLREYVQIEPVREEPEGTKLTLGVGFDAAAVRLTGNVVGQPPFTGTLLHRGWRVRTINLPKLAEGHDVRILAPAEVEL